MRRPGTRPLMLVGAGLFALMAWSAEAAAPRGVSPGEVDRFSRVEVTCPTFSWQFVADGELCELQVYALPEDFDLDTGAGRDLASAQLVIRTWLPAGVTSWTPPMEQALVRGVGYAWFVRVGSPSPDGGIEEAGEWSEARLFSVAEAPTSQEVESALEVLRRHVAATDGARSSAAIEPPSNDFDRQLGSRSGPSNSPALARSMVSGPSAITGEMPDPVGETYGVVGISSSPDGAGLGALNTAGGADLVLDGSEDGAVDTLVRESGIDRPSSSNQSFTLSNSGAGRLNLQVDGGLVLGSTAASALDVAGGINAGSANVGIVNSTGRIPAISATYFANLSGTNLVDLDGGDITTGIVNEARLDNNWTTRGLTAQTLASTSTGLTSVVAAGRITANKGAWALNNAGYGLYAQSSDSDSIYVDGAGTNGVHVASADDHGVYVASAGWSGVSVGSAAVAGMWVASAGQDGVLVSTAGWDGVHVVGPVGGSYYGSGKKGSEDFLVLNTGEVRSKVGFSTPSSGFAQMLPMTGTVTEYEAGDVIIMGSSGDMKVARAAVPNSPSVVGVYAGSAGFLAGQAVTPDEAASAIPVTIAGIVPVRVSVENGPVQPGDLLVTSSTPGHAMRVGSPQPGTILGKALEPLDNGTGTILVLLMLQ